MGQDNQQGTNCTMTTTGISSATPEAVAEVFAIVTVATPMVPLLSFGFPVWSMPVQWLRLSCVLLFEKNWWQGMACVYWLDTSCGKIRIILAAPSKNDHSWTNVKTFGVISCTDSSWQFHIVSYCWPSSFLNHHYQWLEPCFGLLLFIVSDI